jgi:hypothetical protein
MYGRDDDGIFSENRPWPLATPGVHRRTPWRQNVREWAEDLAYVCGFAAAAVAVFAGLSWLVERWLG